MDSNWLYLITNMYPLVIVFWIVSYFLLVNKRIYWVGFIIGVLLFGLTSFYFLNSEDLLSPNGAFFNPVNSMLNIILVWMIYSMLYFAIMFGVYMNQDSSIKKIKDDIQILDSNISYPKKRKAFKDLSYAERKHLRGTKQHLKSIDKEK